MDEARIQYAFRLAAVGLGMLCFYIIIQTGLSFIVGPLNHRLKLVLESQVLLLGLILHIHWRQVARLLREAGMKRPMWIATADCVSFVITFWAAVALGEVFVN